MEHARTIRGRAVTAADPIFALIAERDRFEKLCKEAEARGDDDVVDDLANQISNAEIAACDTAATTIAGAMARLGLAVGLMRQTRPLFHGPEERAAIGAFEDLQRLLPKGGAP